MGAGFHYFSDTDLHGFTQIRCYTNYINCIFQQLWQHSTTNNQPNMNPYPPTVDSEVRVLLPMHQRGTIKAPASPYTTRAGEADRDGHQPSLFIKLGILWDF
jgi:hypothetical protein